MKEQEIVNDIKKYLQTIPNLFYWKEHGGQFGTAGIPDIIVCYKGKFIAFECKRPGGKPTVLQKITINKIAKAGGIVKIVTSVEEVKQSHIFGNLFKKQEKVNERNHYGY